MNRGLKTQKTDILSRNRMFSINNTCRLHINFSRLTNNATEEHEVVTEGSLSQLSLMYSTN